MRKTSLRLFTALLALCLLWLPVGAGAAAEDAIFPEDDPVGDEAIFPETTEAPEDDGIFPEGDAVGEDDGIFPEDDEDFLPEGVTVNGVAPEKGLEVYYFSLERVDGILIRCDGATCFIDVGYHRDARKVLPYLKALGVEKLDCYIGTHAHADHVEGAPEIIYALRPDIVYVSHKQTWSAILRYTSDENRSVVKDTEYKVLKPGKSFQLGGAEMLCLGPVSILNCNPGDNEENANSMICKLVYGSRSFLFTGDAYDNNLEAAAKKFPGMLQSDVMKNPHHNGSHSDHVLELIKPRAVVFCTDNKSLPRNNYLARIRDHKSIYFIACSHNDGNVLITSDGEDLQAYCGYPLKTVKLNPVGGMVPGQKVKVTGTLEPKRRARPELLNWQSSDPGVVKVSRGKLTAVAVGTATITATAINGISDSVEVVVSETGVVLNKHEISLNVTDTEQLKYKLIGNTTAGDVEWVSEDSGIAMVTGEGEVIGVSVGETRVFARTGNGAEAACAVTVTERPVKYLDLNKSRLQLKVGEKFTLEVRISPSSATDKRLEWASSDETVATVDGYGNVTAVGPGSAKIGVRAASGVYDLCRVKVE